MMYLALLYDDGDITVVFVSDENEALQYQLDGWEESSHAEFRMAIDYHEDIYGLPDPPKFADWVKQHYAAAAQ